MVMGVAAYTEALATITERLVLSKEEGFRKEKLSIVSSAFFSEIGNDLLRALLHFKDELRHRDDFMSIPDTDLLHLSGDAARVYGMLVHQWGVYLVHIKSNYPYLYSLALRLNPFRPERSAIVLS